MLSLARRIQATHRFLQIAAAQQLRLARTESGNDRPPRSRRRSSKFSPSAMLRKAEDKSEWWVVDGEMHEIGENVPLRERFVIPRDNIPNKRRKQLREQFMRRTRLVLKESGGTEGKIVKLRENRGEIVGLKSLENRQPQADQIKLQVQFVGRNKESDTWEKASQIRDKFEYDRERRMREKGQLTWLYLNCFLLVHAWFCI
ncbi:hypothetical protein SASPL_152896 [Salvia splendens]|uniref:Uncharacterized protein n=1 Tax=Salvia splendens TaxID=180675 RepID=A0A8X8Z1D0_SALSN|nr:hypothetical protein SASPL_152896 [Salvia splendens]